MTQQEKQALDRVMNGQGHAEDVATLRQALLHLAPSSRDYRVIAGVIGAQQPAPNGVQHGSFWDSIGVDVNSQPTLDWAAQLVPGSAGATQRAAETTPTGTGGLPLVSGDVNSNPTADVGYQFQPGSPGAFLRAAETMPQDSHGGMSVADRVNANMARMKAEATKPPTDQGQTSTDPTGNIPNSDVQGSVWDNIQIAPHIGSSAASYNDPSGAMTSLPQGYSFGNDPLGVQLLYGNPGAYLNRFAESQGAGRNMASLLQDPYKAALAMAATGVIGNSYAPDLYGGEGKSEATRLQDVEEFLKAYTQQGNMVDPSQIYQQEFNRALNTKFTNPDPQTGMAGNINSMIDTTNQALMVSTMVGMPQDAQDWMSGLLDQYGQMYISGIADGSINSDEMSYPKFLQMHGLDKLLQGNG